MLNCISPVVVNRIIADLFRGDTVMKKSHKFLGAGLRRLDRGAPSRRAARATKDTRSLRVSVEPPPAAQRQGKV